MIDDDEMSREAVEVVLLCSKKDDRWWRKRMINKQTRLRWGLSGGLCTEGLQVEVKNDESW